MDEVMFRKEDASKKITILEAKVAKVETNIDTLNQDRRKMENTLKEYLLNIRGQKI